MPNILELFKEPGFAAIAGVIAGITGNVFTALIASRTQRRSELFQLDAKNRLGTLKAIVSFSNELSKASLPEEESIVSRFRFIMEKHYLNKLDTEVYFLPRKMFKIITWLETRNGEWQLLYLTDEDEKLEKKLESELGAKAYVLKGLAMKELAKFTR